MELLLAGCSPESCNQNTHQMLAGFRMAAELVGAAEQQQTVAEFPESIAAIATQRLEGVYLPGL